jgi:hypothetical protein
VSERGKAILLLVSGIEPKFIAYRRADQFIGGKRLVKGTCKCSAVIVK